MAMMPLLRHILGPTRDDVMSAVEEVLRKRNWEVQHEPIVGTVRPDILARDPGGATFVINVNQGGWNANLGAVAQVETFRNAVASEVGTEAKGVLVVAGEASEHLDGLAASAGVEIVRAGSGDIGSVRESLTRAGVLGESAASQPTTQRINGA